MTDEPRRSGVIDPLRAFGALMASGVSNIERAALKAVVAFACVVPLGVGSAGVALGPRMLGVTAPSVDLDSHFRYLSGTFLGLGIGFASCVPEIEHASPRFRLLGLCVILGGLARAFGWAEHDAPSIGHRLGLMMELGVMPLLLLWQARVARRSGGEAIFDGAR